MTSDHEVRSEAICRVQVWHSAAQTEICGEFESRCARLLADQELKDADRFRRTTSRNQHIVGRAMARRLLSDLNASQTLATYRADQSPKPVDPRAIRFSPGDYGKPAVVYPPAVDHPFNIAHTDGLVLCGLADPTAELVGVDVEAVDRRTSTDLAERYFSPPEVRYLRGCPISDQKSTFLRIWTLKEAFIKAIGTGLHTPLCDFAFEEIGSSEPQIRFLNPGLADGRQWRFFTFEPRNGYIASAAIAVKLAKTAVKINWQAFEPLLDENRE